MSINICDIESQLKKLWDDQQEANQIRACLFNLIVFSQDRKLTEYLQLMLHTLVEKLPCRILFIDSKDGDQKDLLTATVSSALFSQGNVTIACDQVTIEVSRDQLHRIPFIVLPLIVSDLPVYLLWAENPTTEKEILPHFQQYASRLIFQSDCAANLPKFAADLLQMLDKTHLELRDFNWAIFGGWRDLLSVVFDTPERIEDLRDCKTITIRYNLQQQELIHHCEIQAVYMQAWIASQMKWQFIKSSEEGSNLKFHYTFQDKPIEITLVPSNSPVLNPGSLLSLEIMTYGQNLYQMERKGLEPRALVHITTQNICEIPYSMPLTDFYKGGTFIQELFYRQTSAHYRNMLKVLAAMNGQEKL